MNNKIPTAEEFAMKWEEDNFPEFMVGQGMDKVMIEFAKLHVKMALKAALEQRLDEGANWNPKSILSAYPEKLIV